MFSLAIIDSAGKIVTAKDLSTAADLLIVVEQARAMIRDCERLAQQAKPPTAIPARNNMPYLT